ncbi:DUF4062 domain-containing protein [uncultured Methanobrevibacter sp.]|uniref:DUF4062 domain-containing protein n=1 Tax=uncultured Methanobrevibacter sp. TaxID=253161 RepID=UPI0025DE9842|nr:DUF4062 domain-containing protein [uncultured Methanobrevibacter sp.]
MKWKKATVFISSTFNDMHAERDYLIKEVFPELNEWCEKRKIRLTDIDLRWGVTEEDSENSKTIETCLRHIDKSRPFFLCFLGQRRGWIPNFEEDINDETKNRYITIDELDGRSATEMEIEHALLKPIHMFLKDKDIDCPASKHSLFFFRDDSYLDELTSYQKLIYTNESEENPDKIKLADIELEKTKDKIRNRKKLEDIKEDGDETKVNVLINDYKGYWDSELILPELNPFTDDNGVEHYINNENKGRLTNFESNGKALKEVIIEQLKEQLSIAFPKNMFPEHESELQKDLNQQEIFCYLNSEGFIPRPTYTNHLKNYIENPHENKICLVSAEAGYGKTMLLAKFVTDFEDEYKDKILYKRFCGASDLSSKTFSLWKSIIDEATISEDEEFYPKNLDELKRKIPQILQAIASKGESAIIIDAVNQMHDGMDMLKWIGDIPDNLKIIISIKEDRTNDKFNKELKKIKNKPNICGFEIKELDDNSKKDLINEYLKNYLKSLDEAQIDTICSFKGSKNPLFLKILLAELRVFGSFDQLKDEIQKFGDSPVSAFNHVLERLEEDEQYLKGENIVPLLFSLLANARAGLSEDEIVTILKSQTDLSTKGLQDRVRLNLRQIRPFMARKEGRHDFFYESFKLACENRYENDKTYSNKILSQYFLTKADPEYNNTFNVIGENKAEKIRPLNEFPYHLNQSQNYDKLSEVLSSYSFIKNKLNLSNIYNLILDYQFDENHQFNQIGDHPIILIGRALELSAPVLNNDKNQLAAQLWGRMNRIDDALIKELLKELDSNTDNIWLKSKSNVLYSPKSSIIKRIKPDGKKSTTAIAMTNDKKIIMGNEDGMLNIFDVDANELDELEKGDSKVIKIILNDKKGAMIVANENGLIKEWDIDNKIVTKTYPKINEEITDIYLSKTYNKIYASSHEGVFAIDLATDELSKEEYIEKKNYNHILVPRRNESIFLCDEKEVDGWDLYEKRKAYTRQYQQEIPEDEDSSVNRLQTSSDIKFMGLVKRFLILISENGHMKMWNTLKNSGGGETIDETFTSSLNDQFAQAIVLEDENKIITISKMGLLRVWKIPEPNHPNFRFDYYENIEETEEMEVTYKDIQTGIANPTAIEYYANDDLNWVIIGNDTNDINIIDLNKLSVKNDETKHIESVLSIKLNDDEMITASENGDIYTWNFDSEEFKTEFSNDFRNECVSFNRTENKLVSAGVKFEKDGSLKNKLSIWKIGAEEVEHEEIKHAPILDLAQNTIGIVYVNQDNLVLKDKEIPLNGTATCVTTLFDLTDVFIGFEDGKIAKYLNELIYFDTIVNTPVRKIKIAGDKLVAGYENGVIEIFDLDGNRKANLNSHEKAVNNLYIDESKIISVSEDNTLKLWVNNECVYTYFLDIFATAINFYERKLVIGDTLGNVRFFDFENFY